MGSKFLDQDVDVVSLASKGIVIGCFVSRNYNKILMETGKLTGNIRVTKNGLGSGVDRMFKSLDSAFYHFNNRLNPFGKSVEFDILFRGPSNQETEVKFKISAQLVNACSRKSAKNGQKDR